MFEEKPDGFLNKTCQVYTTLKKSSLKNGNLGGIYFRKAQIREILNGC